MPSLACQLSVTQCPSCLCLYSLEGTVLRIPVPALHLIPSWSWNNWAGSVATVLFQERVTQIHFDRPKHLETKDKSCFLFLNINFLLTHSIPVWYSSFLIHPLTEFPPIFLIPPPWSLVLVLVLVAPFICIYFAVSYLRLHHCFLSAKVLVRTRHNAWTWQALPFGIHGYHLCLFASAHMPSCPSSTHRP